MFFPSTQKYANSYTRVAPIYPPNKNANISPWELRIQLHSLHSLLWSSLPLVLSSATKEWAIWIKRRKKYMRKAKRQMGKIHTHSKKTPISFSVPHIIQIKESHLARSDPEYLELGLPPKIPHTCTCWSKGMAHSLQYSYGFDSTIYAG